MHDRLREQMAESYPGAEEWEIAIRARIVADDLRDGERPCDETIEGARAAIVAELFETAESWQLKAEEWGPKEQYVHNRYAVYRQILSILNEHLWEEPRDGQA